jgi:hypothetical protein
MAFAYFGVAVLSAVIWCRWLEDHPEQSDGEKSGGDLDMKPPPDGKR